MEVKYNFFSNCRFSSLHFPLIFSHMKIQQFIQKTIDPIYFIFTINILNLNTTLIATAGCCCCWLCFILNSSTDVLLLCPFVDGGVVYVPTSLLSTSGRGSH